MQTNLQIKALLEWQLEMGVDEVIGDVPINRLAPPPPPPQMAEIKEFKPTPAPVSSPMVTAAPKIDVAQAIGEASRLAAEAQTLEALCEAVLSFDGCPLKKTARNTVFADGNPASDIMLIGEAPGADEDVQGIPFCGANGQLLDKMLAAIGLSRAENCYVTNTLFWRPPGNRNPTEDEIAICRPFVEKHIQLFAPKLMIVVGGTAAKSLLNETRGIMKLRGQPLEYQQPNGQNIPVRALFHPSYLLRQPQQKRLAWEDLQAIQALLTSS